MAIIPGDLWHKVQAEHSAGAGIRKAAQSRPSQSWLSRLIHDPAGEAMVASHSTEAGRRYRYYISVSLIGKKPDQAQGWRLPAREIERIVLTGIRNLILDPVKILSVLNIHQITAEGITSTAKAAEQLLQQIDVADLPDMASLIRPLISQVREAFTRLLSILTSKAWDQPSTSISTKMLLPNPIPSSCRCN